MGAGWKPPFLFLATTERAAAFTLKEHRIDSRRRDRGGG
jgi:hypothetical protein